VQDAIVLVVDDDDSIRELLIQFLRTEGFQPIAAANGREAVREIEAAVAAAPNGQLPDLMLLDLLMPEMTGYEVLEYLRRNLPQPLPVLIFSAQRPDKSILKALDSELRDFISKPFELEELLIRMQRLLQHAPRFAPEISDHLRIYTLGSLRIYRGDTLVFDESWRNKPAKTIFKLLFTNSGQRYPKDVLAEELWPETDPDAAANRLRVAVHELRKMLGGRNKSNHISQQEGTYFFDPSAPFWSDVSSFEEYVDRGRTLARQGLVDEALQAYRSAEALYLGDYLRDDPYLEWTVATRERIRELHLLMLSDAARIYALRGELTEAAAFCRKIIRVEPWREEVYRRLMEYLVAAGRPHEALRTFEDCRRALHAEIEASPSAETVALRDAISQKQSAVGW
jgi:two-component SAPR family response regulator